MAVAAIDFRTRRTRELFCCCVHGAGRSLPAVVVDCYAFEDFGELSDDFDALETLRSMLAGAKRPLCIFLRTSRKPTTRRDPSRSTPRRVRLGSRQIGAFFFRHIIAARARYTDYYSLPPRPRPPHDRWRRCGATRAVFSPASAFGLTPDDPVLSPSNRQTSPPKNSKTTRKAPKPQPTDAAS